MSRLTESQQRIVLTLARPLQRPMRDCFFLEVARAIAGLSEIDDGVVHRVAAGLQRQYFDAPVLDGIDDL
jgi:hypothetical protein